MTTSLFLQGCSSHQRSQDQAGQDFEEKHAEDMQKKVDGEAMLTGSALSSTLSLLMPENQESIVEEEVLYGDGYAGFLAYPENNKEAPGVVIIHEWWGLNEHIEDMARLLAMQGYKALAVDLYGGVVPDGFEEARLLSSSLDQDAATANLMAAERYLRESSSKVASLGRCLGGKQSLQLSLASDTLDGTVIYYGRLTDDVAILQNINEPVLGIFAENDQGIPPSAVTAFQSGLDAAGVVDYDITIYPGVDHAFANPTGTNHAEDATLDARSKTMDFLDKVLMDEVAKKKNNF